MSVDQDDNLRVFGQVFFSPDGRGRHRPIANADVKLIAMGQIATGFGRIPGPTNPIDVTTDASGRFDQTTWWGNPFGPGALPEPEAFEVQVTDPDSGVIQAAGQVFSDGDDMWIDSHIAPNEEPLARTFKRHFNEVPELAAFLADGLKNPGTLGQVILARPFFDPKDSRFPSAAEKLFRHFMNLLDRLQAVHLQYRKREPGFDPNNVTLMVPLGFEPLEKAVIGTLHWHAKLSAADRVFKMVSSFAASDVNEDVLRRNISRLITMLSKILSMPVEYKPNEYLWEDMAVILTLFTGIGLVAQRNHIVWADFSNNATTRELTLSTD